MAVTSVTQGLRLPEMGICGVSVSVAAAAVVVVVVVVIVAAAAVVIDYVSLKSNLAWPSPLSPQVSAFRRSEVDIAALSVSVAAAAAAVVVVVVDNDDLSY